MPLSTSSDLCYRPHFKQLTSRIFIKDLLTWNLTVYEGQKELERLLEVADIIDELKMIQHLLETQMDVLKSAISALINLNPFLEGGKLPTQLYIS